MYILRSGFGQYPLCRSNDNAVAFFFGVFQISLSAPGVCFPEFSVTRLTANAFALSEWVSKCCKAFTLPHLPSCVAFTIRAWSRFTVRLAFCQSMAFQFTLLCEVAPAIVAVICFTFVCRFAKLSRNGRPCESLPTFVWNDVADALAQSLFVPLQDDFRFFHFPLPAVLSACLAACFPRGSTTGLPRSA